MHGHIILLSTVQAGRGGRTARTEGGAERGRQARPRPKTPPPGAGVSGLQLRLRLYGLGQEVQNLSSGNSNPLNTDKIRQCCACRELLPLFGFPKSLKAKHGRSYKCKPCSAKWSLEYTRNNREHKKHLHNLYRDRHPERSAWYGIRSRKGKIGKLNNIEFFEWFRNTEKKCEYCDLTDLMVDKPSP